MPADLKTVDTGMKGNPPPQIKLLELRKAMELERARRESMM